MSAIRQVGLGQQRVVVALLLAAAAVTAAHTALAATIRGTWDPALAALDAGTGLLVVLVAFAYLRSVARERRREVVEHMLLGVLATPRNIQDTAAAALDAMRRYGIGDASLVAVVGDGSMPVRPIVARGYPRGWVEQASPAPLDAIVPHPVLQRPDAPHPWAAEASVPLGKRPWVARLPILSGSEPIGVIQVAARRPGVLRDRVILELLSSHLSAAFDHAALYEAAYARERAMEDLETRRREFMAAIAHEIRTPLTSIQAFADLLQVGQADMDETARSLVTSLAHGAQRLSSFVNDLIDLGRSGDAGYALLSEPVDLSEAVRSAEATLRPALILREQAVTLDVPERGPIVVSDPRVVEQVVLNLLSNANRHTPRGGAIRVAALQLDGHTARLEVSDNGDGIPEPERERIFQPYYRVPTGTPVPGSGLGLAVTRRLLEETGGRIWADESDSGGAKFCVEMRATPQPTK